MYINEDVDQNMALDEEAVKKKYEKPVISLFIVEMEDNISAGSIVIGAGDNPTMESWDGTGVIEEEKLWY